MRFPLKIKNEAELDRWIDQRRRLGRDIVARKGPAPDGATYSDGDLIEGPVNVAWVDVVTGVAFRIEYEVPE